MNGKFIALFFVVTGLLCSVFASQSCEIKVDNNPASVIFNTVAADSVQKLTGSASCNSGVENFIPGSPSDLNGSFSNSLNSTLDRNNGVSSNIAGFGFLDVAKLIVTIVLVFLGIPMLAFFASVGTPTLIMWLIVAPIYLLYIFSWIEFFRGGSL